MGYFDRPAQAPAIPIPAGAQLWDAGGAHTLSWRRPLGGCDGYVVLRGATPAELSEVARLPGSATRWAVAPEGGPWLAVACTRGGAIGEPGAPLRLDQGSGPAPAPAPPEPAAPPVTSEQPTSGLCQCCAPPLPLRPGEGALACPHTGELYAVLATGALARAAELPFGLCGCCEARQPLVRCGEAIVCLARPEQAYARQGGGYVACSTSQAPGPVADADAIDAALRANSALLGVNGVFVHEGADPWSWRR